MSDALSKLLDRLTDYLAERKGLLPLLGILFVIFNLLLWLILPACWLRDSNLFLHLGVILAIFGLLLARAL
jgi:hypothetical protein